MDNLEVWWDQLPRVSQLALQDVIIVLAAIIVGNLVNTKVKTKLTAIGFDEYFRFPWLPANQSKQTSFSETEAEKLTLPEVLSFICKATIWAIGLWAIAGVHQADALAAMIMKVIGHIWTLGAVLLVALLAASWSARLLYEFVHTTWHKTRSSSQVYEQSSANTLSTLSPEAIGFGISFIIYGFFILLALISITELFEMGTTVSVLLGIWHIFVGILTALIAFGLCWLGLILVRSHLVDISETNEPESRADHYAGLGIVVGTTIIALGLLTNTVSFFFSITFLLLLGFLLWLLRDYLADLWAGLVLRSHRIKTISIENDSLSVTSVGPLITALMSKGKTLNKRNKEVLSLLLEGKESSGQY